MLNKEFGGHVERKEGREDGQFDIEVDSSCLLFKLVCPLKSAIANISIFSQSNYCHVLIFLFSIFQGLRKCSECSAHAW